MLTLATSEGLLESSLSVVLAGGRDELASEL